MNIGLDRVALVGRMNVGKSTLFNRLLKKDRSIAYDFEGVTRDYLEEAVIWKDHAFLLVDSGGIAARVQKDPLQEAVRQRSIGLLNEVQAIIFVVDGSIGLQQEERELAKLMYKTGKPIVLVLNKSDKKSSIEHAYEFDALGFKHIVSISAIHGKGIDDLLNLVVSVLPARRPVVNEVGYRVSLIGKPNVGKSSLMNLLAKQERSIVSNIEGTTREAVWQPINIDQQLVTLIDTAGIRRQRSVSQGLEELMVKSSLAAIRASHVVLLLIDASQGKIADQELKLAFYAFQDLGRALIIIFNKMDLTDDYAIDRLDYQKDEYEFFLKKIQTLAISCETGKGVHKILPLVEDVWNRYTVTLDDEKITDLLKQALLEKPLYKNQNKLLIYKARQTRRAPLTIQLKVNNSLWFEQNHLGYLEKVLRETYDLRSTPIFFTVDSGA